jgi:TolA-binding protein
MIKKLYNDGEKELLNYLSRFKIKKDDKANIYMMLGNMVKSDGNWKKAIKYYSKYASSEIYTNEGNFLIAELYYDHKKYTNAKKIYTDLLSKNYKTEIIKEKLKNLEK